MERTNFDRWKYVGDMTNISKDFAIMFSSYRKYNDLDPRMIIGTKVLVACDACLQYGHKDVYVRGRVICSRFRPKIGFVKVCVKININQEYKNIFLHDLRSIHESDSLKVVETFCADTNPILTSEVDNAENGDKLQKQVLVSCANLFRRGLPDLFVKGEIILECDPEFVFVLFEFYGIRHGLKSSDIKWV